MERLRVCNLVVQQYGYCALRFVQAQNRTDENCKLAVQKNGLALEYVQVQNRTDEIIKLAVLQNCNAVKYAQNPTGEICKLAYFLEPKLESYLRMVSTST